MPHVIQWSSLLLFLLVVALVAACENKTPRPKTEASAGATSAAPAEARVLKAGAGDAELADRVRSTLASDAAVGAVKLEVDANAGVVILKGQVEKDDTKQRIHELAQKVPGVKWVQNQISVAPPPPSKSG